MTMPPYLDLHKLSEDARIKTIGEACMKVPGAVIGFLVDDEPGKPDRYIFKLKFQFPQVTVVSRHQGPVPGVVLVKVTKSMEGN